MVSIIMPLFNGAKFIDLAVKSVLEQSYKDWELIIIDDGSEDDSVIRVGFWVKTDSRIKLLQHPNGMNKGVSSTRNLGIAKAKGEYIALLDCDDAWLPSKLEKQLMIFYQNPEVVMVYGKARVMDEVGVPLEDNSRLSTKMNRPIVFGNGIALTNFVSFEDLFKFPVWIPASSTIFKKEVSVRCGNFNERLNYQVEDTLLFHQLCEKGNAFFLDEIVILYRVHSSQWNSKLNYKKEIDGKFSFLYHLISSVNNRNRDFVAEDLVNNCFKKIVTNYVSFKPDFKFVFSRLITLLWSKDIPFRYKYYCVELLIIRMISLPAVGIRKLFDRG